MKKLYMLFAIASCFSPSLLAQWTPSGTNIFNSNTGNVGIGTTTPTTKFQVLSAIHDNGLVSGFSKTIGAESISFNLYGYLPTPTTNAYLKNTLMFYGAGASFLHLNISAAMPNSDIRFSTGGWDSQTFQRMIINGTGNVGIGTTTPAFKLDVSGTINSTGLKSQTLQITGGTLAAGKVLTSDATGVATWQTPASSNPSQWTTTAATGAIFFQTGNVSIGTNDPKGYKLAVAGKVVAEEIVVKLQGNWPDYVFDGEYKPLTIEELEQYVTINKHLPGVPTESTVKETGIAVGEMNAILLKKIEELTLYTIELNNRLKLVEKEKEDLRRKARRR